VSHEVTPLERAVLRRLFQEILSAWVELWGRLRALGPEILEVGVPGEPLETPAAEERLLCVTLEVRVTGTTGTIRLCLPLSAVKRLLREEKEAVRAGDLQRPGELPAATALVETPLRVAACLEPPAMTLAALLRMQVGEVLDLRVPAAAPFAVYIGETRKFWGAAGVAGGKVAVRLLEQREILGENGV
jgi:flagellar motor switch protein FliM